MNGQNSLGDWCGCAKKTHRADTDVLGERCQLAVSFFREYFQAAKHAQTTSCTDLFDRWERPGRAQPKGKTTNLPPEGGRRFAAGLASKLQRILLDSGTTSGQ
ncbi:hypothetical protein RB195_006609 [Necator americanus]|uniref:Uncharacterized protein n=1 Tax=Necator americanus TaxID=51031 RepID=A0ABR1BTF2_NECAM